MSNLPEYQIRIEEKLALFLKDRNTPPRLSQAMQYSTLGGGKRIRALLVYGGAQTLGVDIANHTCSVDYVAASIECIHAYSLIHDDLPAMDDDDLRRGKATNHIQFDEPTAILAGDGLLTLAFELISNENNQLTAQQSRGISNKLAKSAGKNGMVGGQMLDILSDDAIQNIAQLNDIHQRKTGALIEAAVLAGAMCQNSLKPDELQHQLKPLSQFATQLGLAFQVIDDILDIEIPSEELGKTNGSDIEQKKATYPALLGIEKSKEIAQQLFDQSMTNLNHFEETTLLSELAQLIVNRRH